MSKFPAKNATPIPGRENQYHGPVCARHGSTERFICNRQCVTCTRERSAKQPRHGLRREQIDLLFALQGSACAICRATDPGTKQGWAVDHDHSTGIARGVLCHKCNTGIGFLRDDPSRLRAAAAYLEGDPTHDARMFFVREVQFAIEPPPAAPMPRTFRGELTRDSARGGRPRKHHSES
jgi:hypothetical protein